jgi:hypothetical protein
VLVLVLVLGAFCEVGFVLTSLFPLLPRPRRF